MMHQYWAQHEQLRLALFASQKMRIVLLNYFCQSGVALHLNTARLSSTGPIYLSIFLLSPFPHFHLFLRPHSCGLCALSSHFVAELHPVVTYAC
jgi:hypothetical protein